jgi:hypothetical protein
MWTLRERHRWLFGVCVGLALCAWLYSSSALLGWVATAQFGVSPSSIERYDLRPFPVRGGTAEQLLVRRLQAGGWVALWIANLSLVVVAFSGAQRKPQPERKRLPVAWLVGLVTCLALTAGLRTFSTAYPLVEKPCPIASLRGVERMSGVHFPAGTVLIDATGYSGWKGYLRAVVRMPTGRVDGFLTRKPFSGEVSRTDRPRWFPWEDMGFRMPRSWAPEKAQNFLAASGGGGTGSDTVDVLALADMSDGDTATVCLEWTRT